MIAMKKISEGTLLQIFRTLPEDKQLEVFDFASFLSQRTERAKDLSHAEELVEATWGSIELREDAARYIAEDKEIEYEI